MVVDRSARDSFSTRTAGFPLHSVTPLGGGSDKRVREGCDSFALNQVIGGQATSIRGSPALMVISKLITSLSSDRNF